MLEKLRSLPHLDTIAVVVCTIIAAYIFAIPTSKNFILYPALAILFGIACLRLVLRPVTIDIRAVKILGLWLSIIAFGVIVAIARGAESWMRTLVFLAFWPIIFAICCVAFSPRLIKPLLIAGMLAANYTAIHYVAVGLMAQAYIANHTAELKAFGAPIGLRFVIDPTGNVAVTGFSLVALLWWGSIAAASSFFPKNPYLPPRWLRYATTVLCFTAGIVSWRRALILALVALPVLAAFVYFSFRSKQFASKIRPMDLIVPMTAFLVPIAFAGAVGYFLQTSFRQVLGGKASITGFNSDSGGQEQQAPIDAPDTAAPSKILESKADGDSIRANEFTSLTYPDSLTDAVIGHGVGASFDRNGMYRDMKPWQTELQYNGMFYWLGAVGILGIMACAIFCVRLVRAAVLKNPDYYAPLFVASVGCLAILLGNATNPYIQAPGVLISTFLPFAMALAVLQRDLNPRKKFGLLRFG